MASPTDTLFTVPVRDNLVGRAPLELGDYVSRIVGVSLTVAAVAAFAFLVLSGIQWITAGGDKNKIEETKNRITGSIIGLAIVAAAWAIFLLLDNFFGIGIVGNGGSTSTGTYSNSTQGTCLYPTSRCCDDINDSNCFCQNANYTTATYGSCNAGGGQTGILCACVPR